ncbi:MAG: metal-dependent transcriptional regulator [Bacilli bacterium]|nr:metal-dependent transcriptional regulator [Bacilli bacterium]
MYNKKESIEDYLEKILMLKERQEIVRAIDIANFMSFSKASVSVALKKLRSYGYVNVNEDNGDISLTKEGEKIATATYERHMIISQSLMDIGVSEKVAYEDACAMEHIISEETFNKLKEQYSKNHK